MTLYLLNYNNYYNRTIKIEGTNAASYLGSLDPDAENPATLIGSFQGINFVPNDGVTTTQILNFNGEGTPDYLLVADENDDIISRWFIIDATRTSGGQYSLSLHRDVIADHYEEVVSAPVFIEKATVSASDPAIYNSEEMTFNQIKQSETPLKDITKSSWIVGYINKDAIPVENRTVTIPVNDVIVAGTYATFDEFPYWNGGENLTLAPTDPIFRTTFRGDPRTWGINMAVGWDKNGLLTTPILDAYATEVPGFADIEGSYNVEPVLIANTGNDKLGLIAAKLQSALWDGPEYWSADNYVEAKTEAYTKNYKAAIGNLYKIGDTYYRFSPTLVSKSRKLFPVSNQSGLGIDMYEIFSTALGTLTSSEGTDYFFVESEAEVYHTDLVPVDVGQIEFVLNEIHAHTDDAPYDMFAIPFDRWLYSDPNGEYSDPGVCFRLATELQRTLTEKYLYDIQLLPYCPLPNSVFKANGSLDYTPGTYLPTLDTKYYQNITKDGKYYGTVFFAPSATFSKTLNTNTILMPRDATTIKVANECDMYRLCSPNYNGQFEFSAVKNKGVSSWNVDCTYKPLSPYIHVAPNFGGLYGKDFDDARGLICGGDFSLAQVSVEWKTYQIQNKNFQNIFDRQIENMEFQNKFARIQDIANMATGSLQGTAVGAMAGSNAGPYGAIIGGIVGGGASIGTGLYDLKANKQMREEALDYTKDQFGYQLGNIRALPYSLTKVSSFCANNKIFPFVEYYSCTDIEKQALRDKIKYNGMSVGRIGKISDFQQIEPSYIKGKLIRSETIAEDYHVLAVIGSEINQGVFI